ncbi:hypothetical protein MMC25_007458 [Agyrium rufum]|nr:hypothetical protein [Agyrium rufum]
MRSSIFWGAIAPVLIFSAQCASAASSWGFSDATVSVSTKGSGVGGGNKEKLAENKALTKPLQLGNTDTLKITLTTQDGKTAKRPHQAFLLLKDPVSGLETSSVFSIRESGKAKLDLTHKEIPSQLLTSSRPITASIAIASFGDSNPYLSKAFELAINNDPSSPPPSVEKPIRYGKLPEINHIFKSDPKSPVKILSLFFTAIVLAALPTLFTAWLSIGGNVNHITKAFSASPVSHGLFFGSIIAMEGIFFMYYTSWNLFQMLPVAIAVGLVTFLSGSRALTEVQERRFAGLR